MYKKFLQKNFSHTILHITDKCNLACKTCFVKKSCNDLNTANAKIISEKTGRIQWLDIGGGEPFLNPEIINIITAFNFNSITIPTNGQDTENIINCVRQLSTKIDPSKITIAVSIDGFEKTNDNIRGSGSYNNAIKTFEELKKLNEINLKINTVLSNKNSIEILDFIRFIRTLAPDYHSLLLLRGNPISMDLTLPELNFLEKISNDVFNVLRTYSFGTKNILIRKLNISYQKYLWNLSLRILKNKEAYIKCRAPFLHRVIYPDGSVSMCELTRYKKNIFDDTIKNIERFFTAELYNYEKKNGRCYCTHNCNMMENILFDLPSVLKILTGIFL